MKLFISIALLFIGFSVTAQDSLKNLNNVVVIGQIDNPEDRFSLEIALADFFKSNNIKTTTSLNIVKQGGDAMTLAADSTQQKLKEKGFDTYMLISVRGYDRKFKKSTRRPTMEEAIEVGHLFTLYREEVVSVSFEITFYQNGKLVQYDLIKVGSVGSRESVLKKLRKKMAKKLKKDWSK